MNYIHLALFIGVVICLYIISCQRVVEGFDETETLIYTNSQCPLLSNQMRGLQEAHDDAEKTNKFSTASSYMAMINSLQATMNKAGCTGKEEAAKVPMAMSSGMTSAEIEAAKEPAPIIDLTQVPSVVTPATGP
jgi:hypothetical protein